jgi:RimJ/RimL family protein N-acetyltransferase
MVDPLLIDLPETIDTERLQLRPPRTGDGALLYPALAESLPELRRFLAALPWVAAEPSPENSELYCRNAQANFLARKDLPFLLFEKSTGQLLGGTGLHRIAWETPKAEVGYWVRTSRSGNGFICEAVAAMTAYAFQQLRAVRVELVTDEANLPSRKVAERCQFSLEGILRQERRDAEGALAKTCINERLSQPTDLVRS